MKKRTYVSSQIILSGNIPSNVLDYKLQKQGNKYVFGCGAVKLGKQKLYAFIKLNSALRVNYNGPWNGRIKIFENAWRYINMLLRNKKHSECFKNVNYRVRRTPSGGVSFGCGKVKFSYRELGYLQTILRFVVPYLNGFKYDDALLVLNELRVLTNTLYRSL